jgi:UDP-glucose 4-epimerase
MKIFVTGSSSHLAAALLPKLCAHPDIGGVTGADIAPPRFRHPRFSAVQADIRSSRIDSLLPGHNALVHLACVRRQDGLAERELFDINVNGAHKAFHAARRAGIDRFVLLSSASVYGSGVHLRETAALAPLPQLIHARHLVHLERLLAIEFPECARLRPHLVVGPNAHPGLKRLLGLPLYVRTRGPDPLLQCVHEDDVARAVLLALERHARGPYNLAVEDNFSLREAARRRHRFVLPLPPFAARAALAFARRWLGLSGELAWMEGLTGTLLLNCRRAAVDLGWRSTHSAASALEHV